MIYKGISWACILFGLILFGSSYELLKYQQTVGEIVAMIMVGQMTVNRVTVKCLYLSDSYDLTVTTVKLK